MATTVDYILKVKTADAKKGLNETGKAAGVASKGLLTAAGSMAAVTAAGAVLVAGVTAVANSIINAAKAAVEFSQQSADLVNDINDLSNRSAIAADTIKGLQFALQASGQNASQATQLLSRFPSVLAQAEVETSRAALGFKNLGVEIRNADGSLRPANTVFLETVSSLQEIEDQTTRSKMAFDIFGRSAGPLLQALGQTQGLEQFVRLTDQFGTRTGPKASDAAADFQTAIASLEVVMDGTKSLFIELFGPKIVQLLIKFGGQIAFVQSLLKNFADTITMVFTAAFNTVVRVVTGLVSLLPKLAKIVIGMIPIFGKFATTLIDIIGPLAKLTGIENKFKSAFGTVTVAIENSRKSAAAFEAQLQALVAGGFKGFGIGGGGGVGGEVEPATKAAGDFSGFVSGINAVVGELDNLETDLTSGINDMIASLEGLPELLEKSFRVSIAGSITEAIVAGVSGPAGFLNTLGDALSGVTMGLSGTIAGAIGGIARLGEKSPKEIQQDFMNFAKAFERGLKILPRVLIQVLPRFALAIITGFLDAIIKLPAIIADAFGEAFARIWESVKEFFKSIFTREGRQERRRERREGRRRFFANLGESSQFYMSGGIMQAQSGARFTGRSRGLAMLHEGETVLPASGRAGQAEQRMMNQAGNGGGINIVINSAVVENRAIDELVRKLETRFGRFGVGKSTLFGR